MLAVDKIKDEPLDEIEDLQQEIFSKEQDKDLMKQQINNSKQLGHALSTASNANHNIHIVDEQDSIITVSAADMRSEDEQQFITSLNNGESNQFKGICPKCLNVFFNRAQFLKHIKRNHCISKQKCPVCPITFIDAISLLNHLTLHRENYFFCSHSCGANFRTLPLCEHHELKEHKVRVIPNTRFKYFCSFCREGFPTELQLHVHWLELTHGCGKLMQDVVLHSNNISNNYDTNSGQKKNLSLDRKLNSNTTNTVTTIPITKLRLKAITTTQDQTKNKRPIKDDESSSHVKRLKMLNQIKTEIDSEELPLNFENEVKIKEEPLDDYESNITTNLIPEVIIKTEEEENPQEQQKEGSPQMTSIIINNMLGPQSSGKFIPLEDFVATENKQTQRRPEIKSISVNNLFNSNVNGKTNNANNQNLAVLKPISPNNNLYNNNNNIVNNNINSNNTNTSKNGDNNLRYFRIPATNTATTTPTVNLNSNNLQPNTATSKIMGLQLANNTNQINLTNGDKAGLPVFKLFPNFQIKSMKSNINTLTSNKTPLVSKLQNASTIFAAKATNTTANPPPLVAATSSTSKACSSSTTAYNNSTNNNSLNCLTINLKSLGQNMTIDAEDFKKIQAEALIKAEEHRKNFYVPKTRLKIIENIPEKKKIIDNMKQKIAEAGSKTTEHIQGRPPGSFILKNPNNEPISLYLPITSNLDDELVQACYKNPNYKYKWICPYCMKVYEMKAALKLHLVKAHNLINRDMEKINVQAKPFLREACDAQPTAVGIQDKSTEVKKELVTQHCDDSLTETIYEPESLSVENSLTSTTTSTPSPPLVQPFKVKNTKQPRSRYACEKCGRHYSSKTMLKDHIMANCSRHPPYGCKECNKKYFSQGTLQCHMTIHTGELPHKCNYCDKRFRTRGQVKVHHRTHTGERPFFCQICSQRFTHRETLIAHLSRHIGMKRYKCYGCEKLFSCISALKTHREIRADTCGKVKFNPRAIGPRVRVIRGNVMFEPQPEINPYLKSEDPKNILSGLQNQSQSSDSS